MVLIEKGYLFSSVLILFGIYSVTADYDSVLSTLSISPLTKTTTTTLTTSTTTSKNTFPTRTVTDQTTASSIIFDTLMKLITTTKHGGCRSYVLDSYNEFIDVNRQDIKGIYHGVENASYLKHDLFHRRHKTGYTLWRDTQLEEWAIYETVFTPPMIAGAETLDQRFLVVKTGCKETILEDCKEFSFTYLDDITTNDAVWVIDDTMKLIDMCRDPADSNRNALLNYGLWNSATHGEKIIIGIIVLIVLFTFILVIVVVVLLKQFSNKTIFLSKKIARTDEDDEETSFIRADALFLQYTQKSQEGKPRQRTISKEK